MTVVNSEFANQRQSVIDRVYHEIKQRHNELLKLETDIAYLNQLFITSKILVENQGDIIINIEQTMDTVVVEIHISNCCKFTTNKCVEKTI
jgi:t-SNARE complex subunit (syntaxin)